MEGLAENETLKEEIAVDAFSRTVEERVRVEFEARGRGEGRRVVKTVEKV